MAAELEEQRTSIDSRLAELEEARLFGGEYDGGDAVVTVNAGAGGTDSQDWAEMLLRMEMRWAERRGMKVELAEVSAGEEAGIKSATFIARGENAYGLFSAEKGVHRLVRISPFDAQSRRHTAFAGLEVAPLMEDTGEVEIEPDDLQIDTYRASGAGGQHVNKTDSAVRITHRPTGHRGAVPERALPVGEQEHGDDDAAREADRAGGAQAPGGDREGARRGAGRGVGVPDPLLRAAAVHDGEGPPDRRGGRERAGRAGWGPGQAGAGRAEPAGRGGRRRFLGLGRVCRGRRGLRSRADHRPSPLGLTPASVCFCAPVEWWCGLPALGGAA